MGVKKGNQLAVKIDAGAVNTMCQERFAMDAKQTFAGKVANDVKLDGLEKFAPPIEVCHLVPSCLGSHDGECRLAAWRKLRVLR